MVFGFRQGILKEIYEGSVGVFGGSLRNRVWFREVSGAWLIVFNVGLRWFWCFLVGLVPRAL